MYEHFFDCPYCGETISVLLDPSINEQKYVEDCEVCCNPMEIHPRFKQGEPVFFEVNGIDQ